jgi:hypothetical protein
MKSFFSLRVPALLLLLLFPGLFSLCYAQKRLVQQTVFIYCGDTKENIYEPEDVNVSFELDGLRYPGTETYYPEGTHTLRVAITPKPGHETMARSYTIKKITWYGETNNSTKQTIQTFNPNNKEYSLTININRAEFRAYLVAVQLDKCAEQSYGEAMVKVLTTISYSPGGAQTPVSDIAVQIGDRPVNIDAEGVGWLKIRPDNYKMTYSRRTDYAAKPGTVSLRSSKQNSTQILGSKARTSDVTIQECDVPLLKENTGSGNLYDFELRINMIGKASTPINEVRVIGVVPGVQVHKAGTPEDHWVELEKDAVLQQGDEISCDPEGSVLLQFADMGTTVVKNTTQLKIASYFTEGGVVKTEILLKMGEVAAKVHKSEATKSDFRIKSPTFTSSRRGTWFSHRYDPSTKTDIIKVEDGTVDVIQNNSNAIVATVKTGQQVTGINSKLGGVIPIQEKIDFSMKPSTKTVTGSGALDGVWLITQGGYTGKITLHQSGEELSGQVDWTNHPKGTIQSGTTKYTMIMFTIEYPGGLLGYYSATLDESGRKMINGTGTTNKGAAVTWSAVKQ